MKHIDKILPLLILAINVLFAAIIFNSQSLVIVFNQALNQNATIIRLSVLCIIVLLIFIALSFVKKIKLQKRYAVFAILSLVLIIVGISNRNVEAYYINSTKECNGKQYYLISDSRNRGFYFPSSSDLMLASSNDDLFLEKIDSLDSIPHIFPSNSLDSTERRLTHDNTVVRSLVVDKIKECPR